MYNFLVSLLILSSFLFSAVAAGGNPPPKAVGGTPSNYQKDLLIDDFDDANITAGPTWWNFDRIQTSFPEAQDKNQGYYTLKITGKAADYYVGGIGTYVGKNASDYDTLVMSVKGSGPNSGTLKLQVFDDDNKTYQLEQDSTYKPTHDDQYEHELPVTWDGWRTIEIPLTRFVDINPGVGDDVLNLNQDNNSGGLLHFQIVVLSNSAAGSAHIVLDNIKFVKKN